MKTFLPLCLVAGMMVLGTVSCKEKKKSDDIIVAKYEPVKPKAPIRLANDERRTAVTWLNGDYTVVTHRVASDSLPMLKDETGQEYVDNRVSITVLHNGKTAFFKKSFTKEAFAAYIDDDFRGKGYLENIIFQGIENGCLKFGVAVSRPGSEDEFVPLDLFIDRQKGIRIAQGRIFDESNDSTENI